MVAKVEPGEYVIHAWSMKASPALNALNVGGSDE